MKEENITFLAVTITNKKIDASYHNHLDDLNYAVEKEEPSHPDLGKAMGLLDATAAEAFHAKKDAVKNFKTKGFLIDEGDGVRTILLTAGMSNAHEYSQTVKTGKIPFESETLIEKVDGVRHQLWKYFFEDYTAQGTLPGMQGRGLASNEGTDEADNS